MASVGTIKYKNGSSWIDILHPVNSFYFSYASASPSSLFGGTWTQITNAALRGSTSTGYTGSDTHTLTINEMPSHEHNVHPRSGGVCFTATSAVGGSGKSATTNWGEGLYAAATGGGQHTLSCNAPSIAISGIALRRGDVVCL